MMQNDARTPRGTKHDTGVRQCASTTQHGCKSEQRIPNFGPTGERTITHAHPLNKLSKTLAIQNACSFQTQADDRENREPSFVSTEISLCTPDAWYDPNSVEGGYEINFNRYFYKPKALRTLEEIRADLLAVEKEAEGFPYIIFGG